MIPGPNPISQEERRANVERIARLLRQRYGDRLLALGLYGSTARGEDGPYSDIEMHCIVEGKGIDTSFEWSTGAWKAEVDVYSPEVILAKAAGLDGEWPITHGQFTQIQAVYDPQGLLPGLRQAALDHTEAQFEATIREVIIGDIYELVGKLRNAQSARTTGSIPYYIVELARYAACLAALADRHIYRSSSRMFEESLALPGLPEGYAALCRKVMSGDMHNPAELEALSEAFWAGVYTWAEARGLTLDDDTEALILEAYE